MEKETKKQKKDVPICCVGCLVWEKFGKNCWYHWEAKKNCTMRASDVEDLSRVDSLM